MTDREFREGLKVGDPVILFENGRIDLKQVKRITATRVFIDDGEGFRKDNGERWGWKRSAGWHMTPHILPPTPARMRMYEDDFMKKKIIQLTDEVRAIVRGRDGMASHEWLMSAMTQLRGIKKQ